MRNHFGYYLAGTTRYLALVWILLRPSPARAIQIGQIVALVDDQGRKIYINTTEPTSESAVALKGSPHLQRLISQTADRLQVDPDLIHAIIKVESEYNPRARSRKGAMGLMQLVPATAQRFGVENPFDPKQNIDGGVTYFKYLLDLFGGNIPLSLAAYNAGEHSVLRERGIPPFAETREYVRKVRSLYEPTSSFNAGKVRSPESGVQSAGSSVLIRDLRPRTPNSISAPVYRYVDAEGVVHLEQ